ncbi:hypothetical protein AB0M28_01935 [Streptomyces sp. NPDC051940]|uniref:hypothetical protein n=1 Tax=Streptomyces sp. NPDC051940 TaxID=3155675 RepID=UPI00341FA742
MTSTPRHRVRLGWEDRNLGERPDLAPASDGSGGATFTGHCPRCSGAFSASYALAVPGEATKGLFSRKPRDKSPLDVMCECGVNHAGRPDTESKVGCGAWWTVPQP